MGEMQIRKNQNAKCQIMKYENSTIPKCQNDKMPNGGNTKMQI